MIVVSDTSPLMNLAVVGRLDLLQRLFHEVLIPQGFIMSWLLMEKPEKPKYGLRNG